MHIITAISADPPAAGLQAAWLFRIVTTKQNFVLFTS